MIDRDYDQDENRELLQPEFIPFNPDSLLLHEGAAMTVQKHPAWLTHLLRILLTAAGVLGALWSFDGFFRFRADILPLAGFILATAAVTHIIYRFPKHGLILLLLETAIIPLMLMTHAEEAAFGIGSVLRVMEQTVHHEEVVQNVPLVTASLHWTQTQCIAFVFRVIAVLLIIVLEFAETSRFCFLLRFLLTFMFLETGLYFGLETPAAAVLLLMCFWIGSMVINLTRSNAKKRKKDRDKPAKPVQLSRRKKHLRSDLGGRHNTTGPLLVTVMLLAMFSAGLTWTLTHDYVRSEKMNERRSALLEAYRSFTIKDITGLLSKLPFNFGPNVISDELNLKDDPDLHFNGSTVLKLKIDPAVQRINYYLRGIVRTTYTGDGWAIRPGDYSNIKDLLQQLSGINRTPQTVWHSDHIADFRTGIGKYPVVKWSVEALQREVINFLPYQTMHPEGTRFLYDTEAELADQQNYDFWTINSSVPDWETFSANTAPSPEPLVTRYEEFVRDYDLRIPDSDDMRTVRQLFGGYARSIGLTEDASLIDKLDAIRDFLWRNADYDTSPGKCPDDADLVRWFLTESHRGYCAHYASAGVLLCRMLGIPARYVQGYVVSQDDLGPADGRPLLEVSLPDHRAHAWAEIYVEGYGWQPFEFTEGIVNFWHDTAPAFRDPSGTSATASTATLPQSTAGSSRSTTTTTRTTPAASQTTASGGSRPSEPGGNGGGMSPLLRYTLEIFIPLLLLAGAVWLWVLYHRRTVSERAKDMRHQNPNLAGTASYAFILYLLRIQHIRQGNRLHGAFAELAEEQCPLLEPGSLTEAVRLQEQAVFSREGITQADAETLRNTAEALAAKLYESSGRFRRFFLRWTRHIVA